MSQTNDVEGVKEKKVMNDGEKIQVDDGKDQIFGEEVALSEELKDSDENENEKNLMPSATEEEEAIKKKYGGLLPKKPTLISKNHDRAFFDSADWALGKQGSQKPKGPLEALRPKLQTATSHILGHEYGDMTESCVSFVSQLHLPRIKAAHWRGTTIILTLEQRSMFMVMVMKHDMSHSCGVWITFQI
uniref:Endosulphine n=1 Tax=Gossypium raimondii TaxID=29730 RepID=A0A0D2V6Y1_GOSRA|nr:hypothetical protein B456_012G186700 [Gossypium raimondii]